MMRRHELSDTEWEFVRPLLPEPLRGRKRDDHRVLNGIVWKFRTGTAWRDVPERYGRWATLHTRFRRWAADGTFERMLRAARAKANAAGDIEWLVSVDSTIVRGHQHAAGARKGGLHDPALGRSRGGLTSRIHLACDARGRPLAFVATGWNTDDCTQFTTVMEAIRVPRIPFTRRPRCVAHTGQDHRSSVGQGVGVVGLSRRFETKLSTQAAAGKHL
ncbi:IS5 family transposase [Streptomyces sp. NPDC058240]|uniref:IS5 family transposase n=1 Tax=Streptomyces sp. NPDC058240 TaxID=3346396 RepID=UPI0036EE0EA8